MLALLKKLGSKVLEQGLEKLAFYIVVALGFFIALVVASLRGWLGREVTLCIPVWVLLLFVVALVVCLILALVPYVRRRHRLTHPADIKNAIHEWLSVDSRYYPLPVKTNRRYYFSEVDSILRIKRRSARRYVPVIALRYGYRLKSGPETFVLTKLTRNNDIAEVLREYIKGVCDDSTRQIEIDCRVLAIKNWMASGGYYADIP
jgi:hypothetical protein